MEATSTSLAEQQLREIARNSRTSSTMDSQSSCEGNSTPAENPPTPQLLGFELPSKAVIPRSNSPTTSGLVAPSSITPPPSSQLPNSRRATTPDAIVLSSPPPTASTKKRDHKKIPPTARPTQEQIDIANTEELKEMVIRVVAENAKLDMEVSEARMSTAHYKLLYNLLTIESEEGMKRMEVEKEIIRREVEVLRMNGQDTASHDYAQKLRDYGLAMKADYDLVQRRLEKAKKVIEMKDEELMDTKHEIILLQQRIRQNREHINVMRSPGGPLHISSPKTTPVTAYQHQATPKQTPNRSIRHGPLDNQASFNALLLAGEVLGKSQENNSAPSTPTVTRPPASDQPRTPIRHNRGAQSLSSFPTTPGSERPLTGTSLLPSAQFSSHAEARVASTLSQHVSQYREHSERARSRDSTISASDNDEAARAAYRGMSEEVQESQASQSASKMLRADPRESFEVAPSRTSTPLSGDRNYQQAKIYGSITKRKLDAAHEDPIKKSRAEGVGLGIGLETRL
ncbi:FAD-dependent oxidoreductase-like enzyme [Diplocarpon rosae]|nr:FAD-dependent oxidoreductase-like enzyme [Diplocarpon rosae]